MSFHRLIVPTYFNGLPGGYDYINNALSGTPALAPGARSDGGPNNGTYFVGFAENALGGAVNRGLKALAQNCDTLDDYLHRDVAIPQVTDDDIEVFDVSSIVLTGPIYTGVSGTPNTVDGIRKFVTLVDSNDNEIFNGGIECQVTAITPNTVGSDWSVGNVTLTVSPAIPASTTFRVYYATRSNAAAFLPDAIVGARRGLGHYNGTDPWADGTVNPAGFVTGQLSKIVADLAVGAGTGKIHGTLIDGGGTYTVAAGTLAAQLIEMNVNVNALDVQLALEAAARVAADAAIQATLDALIADLYRVRFLTAADTINTPNKDKTVILNPAASFALQLPDPTTAVGHNILLINGDGLMSAANKVTLTRFSTEKINNYAGSFELMAPYGRWILSCDGVDWHLI